VHASSIKTFSLASWQHRFPLACAGFSLGFLHVMDYEMSVAAPMPMLKPQAVMPLMILQSLDQQHQQQLAHADQLFQQELQLAHTDLQLGMTERFLVERAQLFQHQQNIQAELVQQLLAQAATMHDDELMTQVVAAPPAPVFHFTQQWEGDFATAPKVGFTVEYDGLEVVYPNVPAWTRNMRGLQLEVANAKCHLIEKLLDRALLRFASGDAHFPYAPFLQDTTQPLSADAQPMTVADAVHRYHNSTGINSKVFDALDKALVRGACPCQGLVHALAQICQTTAAELATQEDAAVEGTATRQAMEKSLAGHRDLFNINLLVMALMEQVIPIGTHRAFGGMDRFNAAIAKKYTSAAAIKERKRLEAQEDRNIGPHDEPFEAFNLKYNLYQWANV
jgi:hypothetical protein